MEREERPRNAFWRCETQLACVVRAPDVWDKYTGVLPRARRSGSFIVKQSEQIGRRPLSRKGRPTA